MKYILFGAGILGEYYLEKYKGKYDILAFADNDPGKQGSCFKGLEIISPDRLPEIEAGIIITSRYDVEIAQQLADMGIMRFFVPEGERSDKIEPIDLTVYNCLEEIPNKVCVIERGKSGSSATALEKLNSFEDLEVVTINYRRRDSEYFYHYLTSRVTITQVGEGSYGKKSIELWHGFPYKRVGRASLDEKAQVIAEQMVRAFAEKDFRCSTSNLCSIFLGYCFGISDRRFSVTGLPRNDFLYVSNGRQNISKLFGEEEYKSVLLYAPTFRESLPFNVQGKRNSYIFSMPGLDIDLFNEYLKKESILLLVKMHPLELKGAVFKETDNIRSISDQLLTDSNIDLYELLNGVDVLITDYSSIFVDYLLLDRPIVFTPLDLEEYSRTVGLLTEPYDQWVPGRIALDFSTLIEAISDGLSGDDGYAAERQRIRNITHQYQDAGASERVLKIARELCFGKENE